MKKLIPLLFVVIMLATGCPQPEPEVHQVEIGMFTPYYVFPEVLNGKIKEVSEKNYMAVEEDVTFIKGERMTVAHRDTAGWTNDFMATFDENGNLLKCVTMDENDEAIDIWKTTVEGDKVVSAEYTYKDTLRSVGRLSYNEDGQLKEIERFRMPEDTLINSVMMTRDENGNVVEWQFYDPGDDPTSKYIYTVGQDGKYTGFKYYNKDGEVTLEQQFTYNDHGFLQRHVIIDRDGNEYVATYDYEYDDMGNWVKVFASLDEQRVLTERDITYYEE